MRKKEAKNIKIDKNIEKSIKLSKKRFKPVYRKLKEF